MEEGKTSKRDSLAASLLDGDHLNLDYAGKHDGPFFGESAYPSEDVSHAVVDSDGNVVLGDEDDEEDGLTNWDRITYACTDFSTAGASSVIAFFYLPFLLETAKVEAYLAAIILMMNKVWDGLMDPVIGGLSDHTRLRMGRRRPWIVGAAVPFMLSYLLMWQTYSFMQDAQWMKFIYYFTMMVLYNTFYTAIAVPHFALIPEITTRDSERTLLTSVKVVFALASAMFWTVGHALILTLFDEDNQAQGYAVSALIFTCLGLFPPFITTYFVKEKMDRFIDKDSGYSFIEGLKVVLRNKPFRYLALTFLCAISAVQFIQSNLYLYIQYSIDAGDQMVFLMITIQVSIVLSVPLWAVLSPRLGKKVCYYIGASILIVCSLGLVFAQPGQPWLYYPASAFAGVGVAACILIPMSLLPETIDVDELHTGLRREGIFYALFIFLQKLAIGVGLAAGGIVLGIVGFDAGSEDDTDAPEDQNAAVDLALRIMVGVIPACLLVISIAFVYAYPIDAFVRKELRSRMRQVSMTKKMSGLSE
eukprot:TRINITY_DN1934_c3_g1_i1.p1 TRINITY_DN1934_c3_g1~~TRINITY_DN1934_c3_g1_i1.p1  ORF type:complete len:531 (-),score=133.84 TRINITY_DN1934_c3_g1_i1:36-1628(-)